MNCIHSSHQIPCRSNLSSHTPRGSSSSIMLAPVSNANPSRPPRSKNRKGGKNWQKLSAKENSGSNMNSQANDGRSVSHALSKVYEMDEEKRRSHKESTVDVVFKLALKEFRSNLISTYSVAAQDGHLKLTYKNLIDHFEQVIRNICQKENTWKSFPVIMGVNAFRGYLDQLRQKQMELRGEKHIEKSKSDTFVMSGADNAYKDNPKLSAHISVADTTPATKSSKKRKRQKKSRKNNNIDGGEAYKICGHNFLLSMANIPTVCEVCSSLMWLMERIWVCRLCKMACHKKCATKLTAMCRMHEFNYKMPDAIAARDAMAKCLYGALFDWIVMQVNHALLAKKDFRDHKEVFYFNQHVFKYEQEEYIRESINWRNIDFIDNIDCLTLIEGRPHGLLYLLDDQCNFPGANNETVLQKFVNHHNSNVLFEVPPCRPAPAFTIKHYAGKVKYQIRDFREKNMDLMRPDIVSVLKVSQLAFVRELVGADPLAIFRWQILKAFFRAYFIFSKLREVSKLKRGLNDNYIINEISSARRSRTSFDAKKILHGTDGTNNVMTGNSTPDAPPVSRISKAILSKQALFGAASTPQCIRGSLIKTASSLCPMHGNQMSFCSNDARVLSKANQILMKHKTIAQQKLQIKSKGIEKSINNLKTLKQLMAPMGGVTGSHQQSYHSKGHNTHHNTLSRAGRKQTPTVTHQFQLSLQQLMEALNLANPFFVRCIKSNGDKIANHFDDVLVLLQLRYTGMLETVRIRQSGYSVRLSYDEFIQHYRILLPKGLLSSQSDVKQFLALMNLNRDNYQIGRSSLIVSYFPMWSSMSLHNNEKSLPMLQQTWLLRKRFKEMRGAAIIIQCHTRRWMAQQRLSRLKRIATYENWAANCIQKNWRSFKQKQWFERLRQSTIAFQSHCRGFLLRARLSAANTATSKVPISATTSASPITTDSRFVNRHVSEVKGSLREELLDSIPIRSNTQSSSLPHLDVYRRPKPHQTVFTEQIRGKESEDSSGIHEDIDDSDAELPPVGADRLPPVLRHKRLSTDRPLQTFEVDDDDDESEPFGDNYERELEDKSRLDRRRNRVVRKLSLKKSKSSKSVTDDRTPASHDMSPTKHVDNSGGLRDHRQLTKIASDSSALMSTQRQRLQHFVEPLEPMNVVKEAKLSKTGVSSHMPSSQTPLSAPLQVKPSSLGDSVGALQKAKKTLKTFIGKSSSDKSAKSQLKPQAMQTTLCYDSGPEEVSLLCSSSQRSALIKRPSKSFEPMAPPPPPQRDFSLMNGHSMRSQTQFRSGELCAVCENAMSSKGQPTGAGVKCDECNSNCLEALVSKCSDNNALNALNINGLSPLHLCVECGHESAHDMIKVIANSGADIRTDCQVEHL
ncbi:unnamed protein product [Medioppia subpectinata]|uniref:Uncharacterized protein n=1 Tax=Medioppia subpectinata TaxID=1979941 RepID=A0A7R9PYN4_9ACAR|nr:unnamed protein product [Medioppia subpectinata]CAG2105275.1 unnamed protein product [Medioppia subpectinata]